MSSRTPHYILYSDTINEDDRNGHQGGRWHFVLESLDGKRLIEADEKEPDSEARGERLELLSLVRGLEAIDEPARVTLITRSRYVRRGLRFGLEEWRRNRWRWEHYGQLVPIKNQDLWRRVDRALRYHQVRCWYWRLDTAHDGPDYIASHASWGATASVGKMAESAGQVLMRRLSRWGRGLAGKLGMLVAPGRVGGLAPTCGQ